MQTCLIRVLSSPHFTRSDAPMLAVVGADLDGLAMKLYTLSTSTAALSSSLVHDVFDTRTSGDVKLSRGITYDMKSIAHRLRSMTPANSSEPDMIMDEGEGRDILSMIKRYDGAVSAILNHHQLYVGRTVPVTMLYLYLVDLLWTRYCLIVML
jgi:hypothetical protein